MTTPTEQNLQNAAEKPIPPARRWGPVAWYTMGLAAFAALLFFLA